MTVTNTGTIELDRQRGYANLSGMVVRATGSTKATSVSIASPTAGASLVQPAYDHRVGVLGTAGVDRVRITLRDASRGCGGTARCGKPRKRTSGVTLAQRGPDYRVVVRVQPEGCAGSVRYDGNRVQHGWWRQRAGSRQFSVVPAGTPTFDPTKVADTFVAGRQLGRSLSADWLGNGHMVVLTQNGLVDDVNPRRARRRRSWTSAARSSARWRPARWTS